MKHLVLLFCYLLSHVCFAHTKIFYLDIGDVPLRGSETHHVIGVISDNGNMGFLNEEAETPEVLELESLSSLPESILRTFLRGTSLLIPAFPEIESLKSWEDLLDRYRTKGLLLVRNTQDNSVRFATKPEYFKNIAKIKEHVLEQGLTKVIGNAAKAKESTLQKIKEDEEARRQLQGIVANSNLEADIFGYYVVGYRDTKPSMPLVLKSDGKFIANHTTHGTYTYDLESKTALLEFVSKVKYAHKIIHHNNRVLSFEGKATDSETKMTMIRMSLEDEKKIYDQRKASANFEIEDLQSNEVISNTISFESSTVFNSHFQDFGKSISWDLKRDAIELKFERKTLTFRKKHLGTTVVFETRFQGRRFVIKGFL